MKNEHKIYTFVIIFLACVTFVIYQETQCLEGITKKNVCTFIKQIVFTDLAVILESVKLKRQILYNVIWFRKYLKIIVHES